MTAEDRIIRRKELERLVGLSRSTIYDGIKRGTFPKPIKIGRRAVGWRQSIIDKWIEARPAW